MKKLVLFFVLISNLCFAESPKLTSEDEVVNFNVQQIYKEVTSKEFSKDDIKLLAARLSSNVENDLEAADRNFMHRIDNTIPRGSDYWNSITHENDQVLSEIKANRYSKIRELAYLLTQEFVRIDTERQEKELAAKAQREEQIRNQHCQSFIKDKVKTFSGGSIPYEALFDGSKFKYGSYKLSNNVSSISDLFDNGENCKDYNFFARFEQTDVGEVSFYKDIHGKECVVIDTESEVYDKYRNIQCVGFHSKLAIKSEVTLTIETEKDKAVIVCVSKSSSKCSFSLRKKE